MQRLRVASMKKMTDVVQHSTSTLSVVCSLDGGSGGQTHVVLQKDSAKNGLHFVKGGRECKEHDP